MASRTSLTSQSNTSVASSVESDFVRTAATWVADDLCGSVDWTRINNSEPEAPISTVSTAGARTVATVCGRSSYEIPKRLLDIVVSIALILLLAPVFAVAGLMIWLTDFGSPIFVQTRVGKGGRHFLFFKFRSMVRNAPSMKTHVAELNQHDDSRTFKLPGDPRQTLVGRLLRRTSIDELPQLFNVLLGDMSLVGPRPPLPSEVALYTEQDLDRLTVVPGLTCIWQVSGRSELPFEIQLAMDQEYIARRSLRLDVNLLFKTVPAVISCRGAY